ncbi:MAG: tRNA (adenosine(37)-N6)-dimethylallyltransferase MiaA, partial [Candidatus Eiseniibacteriota bacterium]
MTPPIVLTGATGTGKTAVSLELAALLGGEILCADSRQLYRGFDVATGKPTKDERARVPHHGFDTLDPAETSSAGAYVRATAPLLESVTARGALPILVGGTGLYLRALHGGLAEIPEIDEAVRTRVRARLREDGPEALHAELGALDAELAARLAPRDGQRIARGLEVALGTGRPLSEWQRAGAREPA